MICQLCTILTSTQLEHKFCAAAIGERPYSALASSDAEIGLVGHTQYLLVGTLLKTTILVLTGSTYTLVGTLLKPSMSVLTGYYAGTHYAHTHVGYLQRLLTQYPQIYR